MAWKTEVFADGAWAGNLRFATGEEAKSYMADLRLRRTGVRGTRVVECSEPVNSTYNKVRRDQVWGPFATGLGALGLLGLRRKQRKAQTA